MVFALVIDYLARLFTLKNSFALLFQEYHQLNDDQFFRKKCDFQAAYKIIKHHKKRTVEVPILLFYFQNSPNGR